MRWGRGLEAEKVVDDAGVEEGLRCSDSRMRSKVPRSKAAGDGWGEGLQKGRRAAPACYTGP